jgi:hypothetical protein
MAIAAYLDAEIRNGVWREHPMAILGRVREPGESTTLRRELRPPPRDSNTKQPEDRKRLCILCGKPSDKVICGACADKVSADAMEKKRWEEKGKP